MATLTTNISSVSLTVSGNTTKTGTISWTNPTVPSGASIDSCVLTGKATASMSKGSATIKVNNSTVSSGSNFTINLGTSNSTTSVPISVVGGNKNASGTVTFSNLVYTVTYSIPLPTYTVTFVDWDGTVLKTQTVEEGSSATAPSNPTRSGYRFTGWDKIFNNITSNITVTALYVQVYTVTFVDWNGAVLKTQTVDRGGSATAPTEPVRDGYIFNGWDKAFDNITSNTTITAQYEINKYIVTFQDFDGSVIKTEAVAHGNFATAPQNPIRAGYKFIGWDKAFTNVTSDLIIIAQYEIALDELRFKENGTWNRINEVYKKVNGVWVAQSANNLSDIFNTKFRYVKGEAPPTPTAFLHSNGTLVFSPHEEADTSYGEVVDTFIGWNTATYTKSNLPPWFKYNENITKVVTAGNIAVKSTSCMFYDCWELRSINLSGFDTSNVTDMQYMFEACQSLRSLDLSNFNTSNVTNMSHMFSNCSGLTSLDLSNFNTSNVTNMSYMFSNCSGLTSLDLSNFNTSNVTDMRNMFSYCLVLTSIDLSNFNTSNVTDMYQMFYNCQGLTSLDVSNFDTSKVTDMSSMFYNCQGLTSLDVSNFDTSNVTNMMGMFGYCLVLTSLDLSNFNTSNVTNMYQMFQNCRSLVSLDLSSFNTNNVTIMSYMFQNCRSLVSLDLSSFNTNNNATNVSNQFMFDLCSNANFTIYVSDSNMLTWVQSTSSFPSTATVVIGSMN